MGITTAAAADGDSESAILLIPKAANPDKIPKDSFHLAYIIYFTLGAGYLLPWNAFITAVDYFTYLYPDVSVDRVFSIVYMLVGLTSLLFIVAFAHKSNSFVRINVGYVLFLLALVAVPLMDLWYVEGRVGVFGGYYVTVGWWDCVEWLMGWCRAVLLEMLGSCLRGVLVSVLRVLTKAIYPQDASGLRRSANLYFIVSVVVMLLNIIFYNVAHRLPVIKYYTDLKSLAVNEEKDRKSLTPLYLMENAKVAIGASFGRLLFLPLFYGCLHGPGFLRTEIPVTVLTCLLGLTNGYFTSVLMILAPKTVQLQHAETAGIVLVLYLVVGLAIGSVVSWFWVL
ncbi:UNVERIFIED_CONTAM: Equilibrative nucleotide transporter 1 [Sesamum latifolium]|uniref:Equilibrative nucleotide transporter 1 n=1 Tax=Sesamum latifolium TaxID=2727402 RepID=A0AAW2UXG4_9LAMI